MSNKVKRVAANVVGTAVFVAALVVLYSSTDGKKWM